MNQSATAALRVVSVNAFNLYDRPGDEARYRDVEAMIRALDADIVAVQEIVARGDDTSATRAAAERNTRRLADAVGRRCDVDGHVACAVGGGRHHTALLWRDTDLPGRPHLAAVPGALGRYERHPAGMWHSLVTARFTIDGAALRVGSVQLSPFDPGLGWGWRDAGQVLRALNGDATPGLVGGDWNALGADEAYDPDPYADALWHPDHAYQYGPDGQLDRCVARRLELGGLRDCAHLAGVPWTATAGRYPADRHPPRRIDRWHATHHLPDRAVTGLEVAAAELVGGCTDHDPVTVHLDTTHLTAP